MARVNASPVDYAEVFDRELFDNPFHEKQTRWLANQTLLDYWQQRQLIDDAVAGTARGYWLSLVILLGSLLVSVGWLQLQAPKAIAPSEVYQRLELTLSKPPPPQKPQKPKLAPVEPSSRPVKPKVAALPAKRLPSPASAAAVDMTPPKPSLRPSADAPLREATTVFDSRFKQQLESAAVARLNKRRRVLTHETYREAGGGEFFRSGKRCFSIIDDPAMGEQMWVMRACPPARVELRRFGR